MVRGTAGGGETETGNGVICDHCRDLGIVVIAYASGEADDYALCLCRAGQAWRVDRNQGRKTNPLWHIWAAQMGVDHDRIGLLEEFFPGEAPAWFQEVRTDTGVLLAAGRTRK